MPGVPWIGLPRRPSRRAIAMSRWKVLLPTVCRQILGDVRHFHIRTPTFCSLLSSPTFPEGGASGPHGAL